MKKLTLSPYCLLIFVLPVLVSCSKENRTISTENFLKEHIEWLADDARNGRLAGSAGESESANYIENLFLQFGLIPAGDDNTYLQHYTLTGPMPQAMEKQNHLSRNIVGLVPGKSEPYRYIIVGAHYDGQGRGGMISMDHDAEPAIHNSADDNASGTAGLIWLARQFAENPAEKSILFAAFSGEEMGLLGSRFFARNMEFDIDSVAAMINLDMIGRLENRNLTIFGTGTSPAWEIILESAGHDSLEISTSPGGSGASDHASFYEIRLPVLHYFSGTHSDYHRMSDTADMIDYIGMIRILKHAEQVVRKVAETNIEEMEFTESTDPRSVTMRPDGVTLGVIPDYTYSGTGFKIDSVQSGSTAERAGFETDDVIVGINDTIINNIYDYMDSIGNYERGDEVVIHVLRANERIELNVTF
jgi:hypothetical protein